MYGWYAPLHTVYTVSQMAFTVYNILRSNLEHEVCYEFVSTTCTSTVHTINAIHFSHMYLFGSCVPLCSVCISPNYNLFLNIETETRRCVYTGGKNFPRANSIQNKNLKCYLYDKTRVHLLCVIFLPLMLSCYSYFFLNN